MPPRPQPQRRKSLVGDNEFDTATIGQPTPRPRHHKRSPTGNYIPAEEQGKPQAWPIGEEKAWKEALKADADTSVPAIIQSVVHNITTTLARQPYSVDNLAAYEAVALSVRDSLIRDWNKTSQVLTDKAPKRVYYFSFEFLQGRSLDNALLNLSLKSEYKEAVQKIGLRLEDLLQEERDAGLGNGGLGRLAACFMDSMATLKLPGWGYGLRYNYGMFKQSIDSSSGEQLEMPDPWLATGSNPWEIARLDVAYTVRFRGTVERVQGVKGKGVWSGGQEVLAVAYDSAVPGHGTQSTANIRFWSARPVSGFDLVSFNAGDYQASVAASGEAETITRVLYPNDSTDNGKELRLRQQAFWVTASLADILRRFRKLEKPWSALPDQVAIQLNDTHPTLAIIELMRVLVDEEDVAWDEAWRIVTKVFSFTNHTVLPEALEKWSVPLMEHLLPRHMQIIFDLNHEFMEAVEKVFPGDTDRLGRMSFIEEGFPKQVRMAHIAVAGSHKVNGVAELHSQLVQTQLFPDFVEFFRRTTTEEHFTNVTNGITPRRWLDQANPKLSELINKKLAGDGFLKDLHLLKGLVKHSDDDEMLSQFQQIKTDNKVALANLIESELGIKVNPDSQFVVQIKRIHLYKRQQLNVFAIISQYLEIKAMSPAERKEVVQKVYIFAGKAAPGYYLAKKVIQLIVNVGKVINADQEVGDLLKVVFLPDYSVSLAEVLIPAADVSIQISCAGTEASGTSNMKLALSGALLLGTVDGANVEIIEEAGEDQCFSFGFLTPQVEEQRYNNIYHASPLPQQLVKVFDCIAAGTFGDADRYRGIVEDVTLQGDHYLVHNDFSSYLQAIASLDQCWKDQRAWTKKCLLTVASMGKFGSDSAVMKYAEEIWNVEPFEMPGEEDHPVRVQKQETSLPQGYTPQVPTSQAPIVQTPITQTTQEPKAIPQASKKGGKDGKGGKKSKA